MPTTWTKIPRTDSDVSPDINDVSSVINTQTTEVINTWRLIESWTKRTIPLNDWESEDGLWVEEYYPWKSDSYPWKKGRPSSTNWNKRTSV